MKIIILFFMGLIGVGCCSCSNGGADFDQVKLTQEMEKQGWVYRETLGQPGKWITEAFLSSETGKRLTAFWVEQGRREQKIYTQDNKHFMIRSFQKKGGDSFVVVFERTKRVEVVE